MKPGARRVALGDGSGGEMSRILIEKVITQALGETADRRMTLDDSNLIALPNGSTRIAMTTDSYIVDPIFFPGGNIGSLAVHGTINDITMSGARPAAISLGLIIEEGFLIDELRSILESVGRAAAESSVKIVCGDTKVAPKGKVDKIYINTAAIGFLRPNIIPPRSDAISVGSKIIVSGDLGDHGIAILLAREGDDFSAAIKSDSAALLDLVDELYDAGVKIEAMRDLTRGGLATALIEMAQASNISIRLDEAAIPIGKESAAVAEIMGLDPLLIANEGKMALFIPPDEAQKALDIMKKHRLGRNSAIIGQTREYQGVRASMESKVGGVRMIQKLQGELLPRIC